MKNNQLHTIKEAAELSGLAESTLRYYETIGIIKPISRDSSSKHRLYNEDDINMIIGVACLNATGMSIGDMKTYLSNIKLGKESANDQIELLEIQKNRLNQEARYLKLRRQYVLTKIEYWQAVAKKDVKGVEIAKNKAQLIAKQLKK